MIFKALVGGWGGVLWSESAAQRGFVAVVAGGEWGQAAWENISHEVNRLL